MKAAPVSRVATWRFNRNRGLGATQLASTAPVVAPIRHAGGPGQLRTPAMSSTP